MHTREHARIDRVTGRRLSDWLCDVGGSGDILCEGGGVWGRDWCGGGGVATSWRGRARAVDGGEGGVGHVRA